MILRSLVVTFLGWALLASPLSIHAADRGPSTQVERRQALEYMSHFEADPLNPGLTPEIQWVTRWVMDVPDVHVSLCPLVDLPKGNRKDSQTLFEAMMFAQIAYSLRNPQAQADHLPEYQAGIEGMLRAYEKVVKSNPKDRQVELDNLVARRDAGTLKEWIASRAPSACQK